MPAQSSPKEFVAQSLATSRVIVGGGSDPGREDPETRIYLIVAGRSVDGPCRITLGLTPHQMVQVVMGFLYDALKGSPPIFAIWFRRILAKRWAVMTFPSLKDPARDSLLYRQMRYQDDPLLKRLCKRKS